MNKFISHSSWMSDIPDGTLVTSLSIPGTHNSCSVGGILGFTKTQDLDLPDQLEAGIRFLDIRLSHYQDNLFVHHDVVYMGKSYADVLTVCLSFLEQRPSETILMSVKDEGRRDSVLGRLAPSRFFGGSRGDSMNWVIRSNSFEEAFKVRTWEHVEDPSRFHNLASPIPGDSVENANLTSKTTLGEVRGKIVLLRRFEAGRDIGFDLTYWRENTRFRSTTGLIYAVEDHWWDPGADDKYKFVIAHMEEARRRDPKDLYITFSSAVGLKSRGYSEAINPRVNDYLAGSSLGRTGIIAMDYFETPRELVSNVIKMNVTADDRKSRTSYRRYPAPPRIPTGAAEHPGLEVHDLDMKLMKIAIEEARASLSTGGVPVGAVLARGDTLLAKAHNERVQNGDPIAHGELACLRNAGRQVTYNGTTLYTTLSPCEMCSGAILQFKIPRVVVGESMTYPGDLDHLRERGVEVVLLNNVSCVQLMRRFQQEYPHVWREDSGDDGRS